ncbi:MAG: aminoacyl-tRNA hydrolase [Verrucomicrobia bacterium]|nr:aminoacyl-tRNA hydrolase [Verrucomicrobiota bacterium]
MNEFKDNLSGMVFMDSPVLIAGLGNPGTQYVGTRHNFGFDIIDRLSWQIGVSLAFEKKFNADICRCELFGRKVVLLKPRSYMNLSGPVVRKALDFFKVNIVDTLVVLDDANLPLGAIRFRLDGRDGGHHGLESVSRSMGTTVHPRQRLGIGRGKDLRQISGYVLDRFDKPEVEVKEAVERRAVEQIKCWLSEGASLAIQKFNGSVEIGPIKK